MAWSFLPGERLSSVDTAWLRMSRPTNLMMITGVMMFGQRLDIARVRRTLESRFLCFERFRQKAVDRLDGHHWETDRELDLDWHVRHTALPGAAGRHELQALASELISTPLDPHRPLWQWHVIDRYHGEDGREGSAVVFRIHHCYADGIALIKVLLSMTDPAPPAGDEGAGGAAVDRAVAGRAEASEAVAGAAAAGMEAPARRRPGTGLLDPVFDTMRTSLSLATQAFDLMTHPVKATERAIQAGRIGNQVAQLALMTSDPPTRFKGELGTAKCVAWADSLPLADVKAVGHALGCSVNDVLLSAVAGALGGYLEAHGESTAGLEIRVLVPVNLRTADDPDPLGNRFGMVFLPLPLGIADPLERLLELRRRMQALKGSEQAIVVLGLLNVAGAAPDMVEQQLLDLLSANATAVMTDVPGPQQPLWFAGAQIVDQIFWVPQSGSIGMGASILSYDGRVQFGLLTDRKRVPDPQAIVERFGREFDKLMLLTLMAPWEDKPAGTPAPGAKAARAGGSTAGKAASPGKTASPKKAMSAQSVATRQAAAGRSSVERKSAAPRRAATKS